MDQGLRTLLRNFRDQGEARSVSKPVDPRYELGAVLALRDGGPALLFENVRGYSIQVLGNLLNTRDRIAAGMEVSRQDLQPLILRSVEQGIDTQAVGEGPVQEVKHTGDIDLGQLLPVPTWFEQERGPYITAGVIVAKNPRTGQRNISIARLALEGGNRVLAGIAPTHHLSRLLDITRELGTSLEISVAIGNHPALLLASQMYVAFGHDEYRIAGSLLGEPLRTVKAISVDIEVPAEAEIVLEGYLHPDHRIEEGPVSEFHGYYELYGAGHGGEIVTVTHRRDPIYQAILPGSAAEHHLLGAEAIGATTCYGLRQVIPRVRQVVVTQGGMGRLHAVIAMHKPHSGEGKRAALLAMGWTNLLKKVTVVDDDIDPSDPTQVEWAVANRMRAEEDVSVLPNMKADRCDPQERNGTVAKMCIDATASRTKPPGGGRGMALPPQEVLQRIRDTLEEY